MECIKNLLPKIVMHMQLIIYKFNQQVTKHILSIFGTVQLFKAQWYLSKLGALTLSNTESSTQSIYMGSILLLEKQQILLCSAITSFSFQRMLFFLWGTKDLYISFSWTTMKHKSTLFLRREFISCMIPSPANCCVTILRLS